MRQNLCESSVCVSALGMNFHQSIFDHTDPLAGEILGKLPDKLRFDRLVVVPAQLTEGSRIGNNEQARDLTIQHFAIEKAGDGRCKIVFLNP